MIGSFGNVTSAIVCAASSFSLSVTDPAPFLKDMDVEFFRMYKNAPAQSSHSPMAVKYVEPRTGAQTHLARPATVLDAKEAFVEPSSDSGKIESRIVVLEDFIDTDAV